MHADSLLWKRDILERSDRGHVDVPCLIEGHNAAGVLLGDKVAGRAELQCQWCGTDTIKGLVEVQLQPMQTGGSLLQRSLYHAEKLHGFAEGPRRYLTGRERSRMLAHIIPDWPRW